MQISGPDLYYSPYWKVAKVTQGERVATMATLNSPHEIVPWNMDYSKAKLQLRDLYDNTDLYPILRNEPKVRGKF